MFFHIEHTTEYVYPEPAVEAFTEMRLRPRDTLRQTVSHHHTRVSPKVLVEDYTDYFGNYVETLSIPFRHNSLTVTSVCDMTTGPHLDAFASLQMTVCEASQLMRSQARELHDFLSPSVYVKYGPELRELSERLMPSTGDLTTCLNGLNTHIFKKFKYLPGSTDVNSSVSDVLKHHRGVCQDFAHLMIGICRLAGIPARYVSGYIETDPSPDEELVGATASHAWVEVYSPNGFWVGFDPTNNQREGERHVQIGIGRDYADVPPLKGIFKGPNRQSLSVDVRMSRNERSAGKKKSNSERDNRGE